MKLIAILEDGTPEEELQNLPQETADVFTATAQLYQTAGYPPPWIGYLAVEDGRCVGTCVFKGAPAAGAVEIAYYTFPEFEGRGVATWMATALIDRALRVNPDVKLKALTLAVENASAAILRKLKFRQTCTLEDPRDGLCGSGSATPANLRPLETEAEIVRRLSSSVGWVIPREPSQQD